MSRDLFLEIINPNISNQTVRIEAVMQVYVFFHLKPYSGSSEWNALGLIGIVGCYEHFSPCKVVGKFLWVFLVMGLMEFSNNWNVFSIPFSELYTTDNVRSWKCRPNIWVKVFKNGPSNICGRQPLKKLKWRPYSSKFFKGCLPQILLGPFLITLTHLLLSVLLSNDLICTAIFYVTVLQWFKINSALSFNTLNFRRIDINGIEKLYHSKFIRL